MTQWTDRELGVFKYDDLEDSWARQFDFPAWKPFSYRWYGRNVGRSKVWLRFEAEDATQLPSKQAVAVARRVVKNHELLAQRIVNAVWNDLQGKGEDSGMWWHGDVRTINEMIDIAFAKRKRKPFEKPEDLYQLIGSPRVWIQESIWLYEKPLAMINFDAAFDVEHGLGVLTNGNRVIGTGYQVSVSPYFKEQFRK